MRLKRFNSKVISTHSFIRRMNILRYRNVTNTRELRKDMKSIMHVRTNKWRRSTPSRVGTIKWRIANATGRD